MIPALKSYPTYKPSGVEWLGDVPEHWMVKRGKALFHCVDVRSSTGEEELLTVSSERGVVPRSSATVTMFKAESYAGYKLCWPNDLVINSLWAWARGLGVARHHGIISSAYGVYRLRPSYTEYSAYVHDLVRSTPFNWELLVRSKGIWISRLQLTDEAFLGAPFPLPPSQEQSAIVRYLDHVDRRIRRYIRAKQKLIKLLEEQKQALIHQSVTRGLDPNVRIKPSGVEWLGDVPEHWEVIRFRRLITLTTGFPFKSEGFTQSEEDVRLLRGVNIAPGRLRWEEVVRWSAADTDNFAEYQLELGDIVLGMDRPIIQDGIRVAVVEQSDVPSLLLQRVARIRPGEELKRDFTLLLLRGKSFSDYLAPIFTGISVPHLSPEQIGRFRFALPSLAEQEKILEQLRPSIGAIRSAMDRALSQILLLREYRTRLIADVVTGKLDVREAAASLLEEADERDPLDEGVPLESAEELAMESEVTV